MAGIDDQLEGKAKEFEGKITGDAEKEAEGKTQNTIGDAEKAASNAGDRAEGAAEAFKDKL